MKWLRQIFGWLIERFLKMNLPVTQDGYIDATKVILAVIYEFKGKKVFQITLFENGVPSTHWVEWSQQLENWLMSSGVNVTENISVEKDFNLTKEKVLNIPIQISNKPKVGIRK